MCHGNCRQGRNCDCADTPLYTPGTVLDTFLLCLLSFFTALLIAVPLYLAVTQ